METLSSSHGDILVRESATLHWGSSCNSFYIAVGDSQQKYGKPPADLSKPTVSNNAGEIP